MQLDQSGHFIRANKAYCDMVGYSEAELACMTTRDLDHSEERDADWSKFRAMLVGATTTYATEKRYVRKDDRIIWVSVTGARASRTSTAAQAPCVKVVTDFLQ